MGCARARDSGFSNVEDTREGLQDGPLSVDSQTIDTFDVTASLFVGSFENCNGAYDKSETRNRTGRSTWLPSSRVRMARPLGNMNHIASSIK